MAAMKAAATSAPSAISSAARGTATRWGRGTSASAGAAWAEPASSRTVLAMRHDTLAPRWQRFHAMPGSDALLMSLEPWAWPWTALLLGLVVGSFANVCIYRLPLRRSLSRPGSACPACGASIRPWDNVPVLSWTLLRGRCRECRARISARYPLVEATNGALWLGLAWRMPPRGRAAASMVLRHRAAGAEPSSTSTGTSCPTSSRCPGRRRRCWPACCPGRRSPLESALTAAGGYPPSAAVAAAARGYYGEDALGQGDWKMAALLGAFLGWRALLATVFFACVAGALAGLVLIALRKGSGRTRIPLGTFLGLAGIVAVFAAEPAIAWYGGLLDG